jgi:hypothetical protein
MKALGMSDQGAAPGGECRQIQAEKIMALHALTLPCPRAQATCARA